jgi:hypothetical protein
VDARLDKGKQRECTEEADAEHAVTIASRYRRAGRRWKAGLLCSR